MDTAQTNKSRSRASVVGHSVISISEGLELGRVKQIIIGPSYRVEGFLVGRRRSREERILALNAISSFGTDRITVQRQSLLEHSNGPAGLRRQLRRPLPLIGARVFTAGGRVLGKVEEYFFSIEDGSLTALEISGGKLRESLLLPGNGIIAISPQTVMIKDEALNQAQVQVNPLRAGWAAARDSLSEAAGELADSTKEGAKKLAGSVSRLREKDLGHSVTDDGSATADPSPQLQPDGAVKPESKTAPEI